MYEGLTPLWKESLDFPFTPPMADFSPANLAQVGACMGVTHIVLLVPLKTSIPPLDNIASTGLDIIQVVHFQTPAFSLVFICSISSTG